MGVGANHILPPVTHDGQVGEAEASVPKGMQRGSYYFYHMLVRCTRKGANKRARILCSNSNRRLLISFRNSFAAPPTASLKENPPTTRPTTQRGQRKKFQETKKKKTKTLG
jgi:hypothetical protein